jgi:hypothetical protein
MVRTFEENNFTIEEIIGLNPIVGTGWRRVVNTVLKPFMGDMKFIQFGGRAVLRGD